MAEKKENEIKVTYVNEELFRKNPSLKLVDDQKYSLASALLKSPTLAYYTLISQKTKSETPIMNIGLDTLPIIKGIPKQVVTIGELASYYMVEEEVLYNLLSTFNFDLEKIQDIIIKLEANRNDYISLSNGIGAMIINYHGNTFTATIEELAHMTQIPFKFLYEAYVNSDFNMSKALESLETTNKKLRDMQKLNDVLDVEETYTPGVLEKYRSMVGKGIAARNRLWARDLVIGAPRVKINNVSQYLRMCLTDIDSKYYEKDTMDSEEILLFLNAIITILHNEDFDVFDLRQLIIMSEMSNLPKELNTLAFKYLKARDKSKINLEEIVEKEIEKVVKLLQISKQYKIKKDNI